MSKRIFALLLSICCMTMFGVSFVQAIQSDSYYEKTYGISYEELFTKYPQYLNNQNFNNVMNNIDSAISSTIYGFSAPDEDFSAWVSGLKNGLWYYVPGYDEYVLEEMYKRTSKKLINKMSGFSVTPYDDLIEEIKGKYFVLAKNSADMITSADKSTLVTELSKVTTYFTTSEIEEYVDKMYDNKFEILEKVDNLFTINEVAMIVLAIQEVEYGTLFEVYNSLEESENSVLKQALQYHIDNYYQDYFSTVVERLLKEQFLPKLASKVEKVGLTALFSAGSVTFASAFWDYAIIFCEWSNAEDIMDATTSYSYAGYLANEVASRKVKMSINGATETDIKQLETLVKAELAAYACALEDAKKITSDATMKGIYAEYLSWFEVGAISYDTYIEWCMAALKADVDAGILVLDETPDEEQLEKDSEVLIAERFAEFKEAYPVGSRWYDYYKGGWQCYGFAKMCFDYVFGVEIPCYDYNGGKRYQFYASDAVVAVGQLTQYSGATFDSVKSLFSQAKLGDVIQSCRGDDSQHTMIYESCDDYGITVLDCNSDNDCIVAERYISYDWILSNYCQTGTSSVAGVTVYRAHNYARLLGTTGFSIVDDSANFVITDGVLTKYNGSASIVAIPDEVTAIGDKAFQNNKSINFVRIGDNVTSIGQYAFDGCTNLYQVDLPDSIASIGSYAFQNCSSLKAVDIPELVTIINAYTWSGCSSLWSVNMSDNVVTIEKNAFSNCTLLTDLYISNNATTLSSCCFSNCTSLAEVVIPRSVTSGGEYSNIGTGHGAFYKCSSLKNVTFEYGTIKIANCLFNGCDGIEEITMPDTVTTIGAYAFAEAENLKTVHLSENLTTIGVRAFCWCASLKDVVLPDSIVTLSGGAFVNCDSLTYINMPSSLESTTYSYYDMEDGCVFSGCDNLKEIIWGKGIKYLPINMFRNTYGLESVTIPSTITNISNGAFYNCTNLENVVIQDGVVSIGSSAFYSCTSMTSMELPDSITTVNQAAFSSCTALEKIHLPDSITAMGISVFSGCTKLKEVNIPSTRANLMENTFYNCQSLETVEFPETLKNIQEEAFYNCTKLNNIKLPSGLQTIGYYAFYNCTSLESIEIPDSVTSIVGGAFCKCSGLSDVKLGNGIKQINSSTFRGTGITSIVIPNSVTQIYDYAFAECIYLTEAVIPPYVTSISDTSVFSYPKKMTIYGVAGSAAQTYAEEKGITFVETTIEEKTIAINADNFPDEIFREFVAETYDTNRDGLLAEGELLHVTSMNVSSKGISDLTGIEYFTGLTSLNCSSNNLTSLDLSRNNSITSLSCSGNTYNIGDVVEIYNVSALKNFDVNKASDWYGADYADSVLSNFTKKSSGKYYVTYSYDCGNGRSATFRLILNSYTKANLNAPVITAAANENDTVTISWAKVEDASKYEVYCGSEKLGETSNMTYTTAVLAPGSYTFTVRAANADGTSAPSNAVTITIEEPEAVFTVSDGTSTVACETWTEVIAAVKDKTKDYTINVLDDYNIGKTFTTPTAAKAKSVTLISDGCTLSTSAAAVKFATDVTLINVSIESTNSKGCTITAGKNVTLDNFESKSLTALKGGSKSVLYLDSEADIDYQVTGFDTACINAETAINSVFTVKTLNLNSAVTIGNANVTVTALNAGENAAINYAYDFIPLTINGDVDAETPVEITVLDADEAVTRFESDTQVLTAKTADITRFAVNPACVPSDTVEYTLSRNGSEVTIKAVALYLVSTEYGEEKFALWTDLVKSIETKKNMTAVYTINVAGDCRVEAALKMPKAKTYGRLVFISTNAKLSFIGTSITLTGATEFRNIELEALKKSKTAYTPVKFNISAGKNDLVLENVTAEMLQNVVSTGNAAIGGTTINGNLSAKNLTIGIVESMTSEIAGAVAHRLNYNPVAGPVTDVTVGGNLAVKALLNIEESLTVKGTFSATGITASEGAGLSVYDNKKITIGKDGFAADSAQIMFTLLDNKTDLTVEITDDREIGTINGYYADHFVPNTDNVPDYSIVKSGKKLYAKPTAALMTLEYNGITANYKKLADIMKDITALNNPTADYVITVNTEITEKLTMPSANKYGSVTITGTGTINTTSDISLTGRLIVDEGIVINKTAKNTTAPISIKAGNYEFICRGKLSPDENDVNMINSINGKNKVEISGDIIASGAIAVGEINLDGKVLTLGAKGGFSGTINAENGAEIIYPAKLASKIKLSTINGTVTLKPDTLTEGQQIAALANDCLADTILLEDGYTAAKSISGKLVAVSEENAVFVTEETSAARRAYDSAANAVTDISALKNGNGIYTIALTENIDAAKMPLPKAKTYNTVRFEAYSPVMITVTSDITLTGNLVIGSNVTLQKMNKKGENDVLVITAPKGTGYMAATEDDGVIYNATGTGCVDTTVIPASPNLTVTLNFAEEVSVYSVTESGKTYYTSGAEVEYGTLLYVEMSAEEYENSTVTVNGETLVMSLGGDGLYTAEFTAIEDVVIEVADAEDESDETDDTEVPEDESDETDDTEVPEDESDETDDTEVPEDESDETDDTEVPEDESDETDDTEVPEDESDETDDTEVPEDESDETDDTEVPEDDSDETDDTEVPEDESDETTLTETETSENAA